MMDHLEHLNIQKNRIWIESKVEMLIRTAVEITTKRALSYIWEIAHIYILYLWNVTD